MANRTKLTIEQIIEIHKRANAGETRKALAYEFGIHRETVRKFAITPLHVLEEREIPSIGKELKASPELKGKSPEPKEGPPVNPVPIPEPIIKEEPKPKAEAPVDLATLLIEEAVRKPSFLRDSSRVRRGSLIVTREGSYLQFNSDGRIVRVLSCPVYAPNWTCIRRDDVDVVGLDGNLYRGRLTLRSGQSIHGSLSFTKKGKEVTRVEFHADCADGV